MSVSFWLLKPNPPPRRQKDTLMKMDNVVQLASPEAAPVARSVLDELVREGARLPHILSPGAS